MWKNIKPTQRSEAELLPLAPIARTWSARHVQERPPLPLTNEENLLCDGPVGSTGWNEKDFMRDVATQKLFSKQRTHLSVGRFCNKTNRYYFGIHREK